jgi:hypothetical protein
MKAKNRKKRLRKQRSRKMVLAGKLKRLGSVR